MRCILSITAIFLVSMLSAQTYSSPEMVSIGREQPRSKVIPHPTEAESIVESDEASKYLKPLDNWSSDRVDGGTIFTTDFTVPFAWANRQVLLFVESVSSAYEVCVNGRVVGYNQNGGSPAEYNLTKAAGEGRNAITITVFNDPASAILESWPRDQNPVLGRVCIMSQPTIRVRDVAVRTNANDGLFMAEIAIAVKSDALNPKSARIHYQLVSPDSVELKQGFYDLSLDMRREDTLRILAEIPRTALWSVDNPNLCMLYLKTQTEGRYTEYTSFRLGFRTIENDKGRLLVNGEPQILRVTKLPQELTGAEILELKHKSYNTIKLPTRTASRRIYDLCDLMGMYLIEQTPIDTSNSGESIRKGGNPSNDPAWRKAYCDRAVVSYHTSKLHPSVIAFALADRSANGICLYESYMALKRMEQDRPVIYLDAQGQWNSDRLEAQGLRE